MTLTRKLVLALFLAFLSTSYSNSQTVDPTTGNLINTGTSATDTTSTWNNGVYVDQLCFYGGDPGNCGPNPSIRSGGVINYSYGTVDLNQIVNINKALSIGGSGVQLSGFNFGFMAKNGNGWDDGRQDYLGAYVKFYNSAGGLAANYDYTSQTNQRYNWTQFNFSETFASPASASTYGNAQVGFVGRDNNFWAGNYGPEIYNVSFSLKYSVKPDPCINDPLSSPTCPGYALATVKNSILGSTVSNASVTSFVPAINYTAPADATQTITSPTAAPPPPPPPPPDSNQNPSVAQDGPAQPGPQQAGPAPTGPQPAGGPPPTTQTASAPPPSAGPQSAGPQQGGGSGSGPSKLAMSVVKSAQAKEQAIQQTAVQNAVKAFEGTVQSSQTASNAAVAMNQDMSANSATAAAQFSSQTTQASMQTAVQSMQSQVNTQQVAATVQSQRSSTLQATQQTSSGTGLAVSGNPFAYNPLGSLNTASMSPPSAAPSTYQPRLQERSMELDTPQLQVVSVGGVGKAGNPLSDIMNQRIDLMQTNIEQRSDTVKKNVSPNELAGGVDVATMAQIPKGYEAYSVVTLRDAAFYEPKEVYKNQKTVDNVRALRQMSSDSLHKQMVDSQYKEK